MEYGVAASQVSGDLTAKIFRSPALRTQQRRREGDRSPEDEEEMATSISYTNDGRYVVSFDEDAIRTTLTGSGDTVDCPAAAALKRSGERDGGQGGEAARAEDGGGHLSSCRNSLGLAGSEDDGSGGAKSRKGKGGNVAEEGNGEQLVLQCR
ncbi:Werner Syndrome-like exonuclease [Panicum miliaceum]|uniref:Werner Syndrome-like exonuclease n=1 Tax=Panicum miliaceum TaxID=4540 RepID=A0A3L6SSQ5_PANMI|nr:Werner Syndrome-like exonuclease [Panicum miliaceum]